MCKKLTEKQIEEMVDNVKECHAVSHMISKFKSLRIKFFIFDEYVSEYKLVKLVVTGLIHTLADDECYPDYTIIKVDNNEEQ